MTSWVNLAEIMDDVEEITWLAQTFSIFGIAAEDVRVLWGVDNEEDT